jgi:hypothetical protein
VWAKVEKQRRQRPERHGWWLGAGSLRIEQRNRRRRRRRRRRTIRMKRKDIMRTRSRKRWRGKLVFEKFACIQTKRK